MKLDICIPTYEAGGRGHEVLEFSFQRIAMQTYTDFRVIIADHSQDDKIKDLCKTWKNKFDIKYVRNERGRGIVAANLNCLLDNADGDIIKWLDQDDYLFDEDSLRKYAEPFEESPLDISKWNGRIRWIATSYFHTKNRQYYYNQHFPNLNTQLYLYNTVGTMSCTAFRNIKEEMPRFDENLKYHHDCDWTFRYWKQFGLPVFSNMVTIANFIWENSFTSSVTQELMDKERQYLANKYVQN